MCPMNCRWFVEVVSSKKLVAILFATALLLPLFATQISAAEPPKFTPEQLVQLREAKKLNDQAVELEKQGKYKEALEPAKKVLEVRQKILGEKNPITATALMLVGHLSQNSGDAAAAKSYFEQALAIRQEVLGKEHADTATTLSKLGFVLQSQGDYAGAKANYTKAVAIRKKVLGEKDPDYAAALANMGYVLEATGDFGGARPYYEQSLAILQEVRGPKHPATAQALSNMGVLLRSTGDYEAAKPYFEKTLAIRQEALGPKHPMTAGALDNMGLNLQALGQFAQAKPYFEQALAIRQEVLGPKHPATIGSLNNMGRLLGAGLKDPAAARPYYEKALAISQEVHGPKHPQTILLLNNLGLTLIFQGDYTAAKPYLQQAVDFRREVYGAKHPKTAHSLANLASAEVGLGDWAAAGQDQLRARKALREHVARVLPSLSQREQLQFVQNVDAGPLHQALSMGLYQKEHKPLGSLSFEFWVNGKAVIQESLAERAELAMASTDPNLKGIVQELQSIRTQMAKLSQTTPAPSESEAYLKQVDGLEQREQELADKLNAGLGRRDKIRWFNNGEVRRGMPAGVVLIDIARFAPFDFKATGNQARKLPAHYVAWVVPPARDGEVRVIDLGDADKIDAAVEAFQVAFKNCQSTDKEKNPLQKLGERSAEQELKTTLGAVGKLVLDPLKPHLKKKTDVIISPDAALWLVPWSALPIDGDKYAIEQWNIRYVTSARDLVAVKQKLPLNPPDIFANPNYNLAVKAMPDALASVLSGKIKEVSTGMLDAKLLAADERRVRSASNFGPVPQLPATAQEAAAIAPNLKKFASGEPFTFAGNAALEGAFKRLRSPRVLVMSTHGFFLPEQHAKEDNTERLDIDDETKVARRSLDKNGEALENPLVRCGLLLAGCNNRDQLSPDSTLDDGVLTGMEIVGTDLRGTELVVLSACETGIGKVNNGEGVAGLRQAFQLAGAQSVVATLWQIPDQATAQLMNDFFANLAAGQSKPDALRNAQLKTIKARRDKYGAAHPLFWAAFTLTGGN